MPHKDWPLVEMESQDIYPNYCKISLCRRSIFRLWAHITQRAIVSATVEGLYDT